MLKIACLTTRPHSNMSSIKISKSSSKQFKVVGCCCYLLKNVADGLFLAEHVNRDFLVELFFL